MQSASVVNRTQYLRIASPATNHNTVRPVVVIRLATIAIILSLVNVEMHLSV